MRGHHPHTKRLGGVWSRARPIKGDRTPREFEQAGKPFFFGKAKCNMKEQDGLEAEEGMEEEGSGNEVHVNGPDVLVGKEDGILARSTTSMRLSKKKLLQGRP